MTQRAPCAAVSTKRGLDLQLLGQPLHKGDGPVLLEMLWAQSRHGLQALVIPR